MKNFNLRKMAIYGGIGLGTLGGAFAASASHSAALVVQLRAFGWAGLNAGLFGAGVIFAVGHLINLVKRS